MSKAADTSLFLNEALFCMNSSHVLSRFLLHPKQHQYNMRTRAHNFSLPPKRRSEPFIEKAFIETYTEYIHSIIFISSSSSFTRPATILVLIFNLYTCTLNAVCHFSD